MKRRALLGGSARRRSAQPPDARPRSAVGRRASCSIRRRTRSRSEDLAYPAYGQSLPPFELRDPIAGITIDSEAINRTAIVTGIFTFCPAECGILLRRLVGVQRRVADAGLTDETLFLPITFDPERDDEAALRDNAESIGADLESGNWHYLRPESPERAKAVVEDRLGIGFERTTESDRVRGTTSRTSSSPCSSTRRGRRARLPGRTDRPRPRRRRHRGGRRGVRRRVSREGNAQLLGNAQPPGNAHDDRARTSPTVNIDILLYDGFDELDGIGPYEVFDYALGYAAERASDGADGGTDVTERPGRVRYVTLDEREWVTASHGTRVGVDGVLPGPNADEASDLLVVPGGGWTARDEDASAWAEAQKGDVPRALGEYHAAGVRTAAVCTGAMMLLAGGRASPTGGARSPTLRRSTSSASRAPRSWTRASSTTATCSPRVG